MKHMKHMIGCFAMIAVVAVIFLARGGDTPGWLPIVLVLCCPLMMIGMMVMMSRDNGTADDHSKQPARDDVHPVEQR